MGQTEVKGYCQHCKADEWSRISAEVFDRFDDDENGMWWIHRHRILECKACGNVFYQREEKNSEDLDFSLGPNGETITDAVKRFEYFPPKPKWPRPEWSDEVAVRDAKLANILSELYTAFDNELTILTAIGIRTAFDRITEVLSIDPALSFTEKTTELVAMGLLPARDRATIETLVNAGSAAAHRGWDPSVRHLKQLLKALEMFTYKVVLTMPSLEHLNPSIPPRPSRRQRSE